MPKKTKQIRETDPYYCSRRNENMKVGKCLNYFVDANAFEEAVQVLALPRRRRSATTLPRMVGRK